jgi:hypothetical protein
MRAVEQHVQPGSPNQVRRVLVLERLHRHIAVSNTVGFARLPHEQTVGVFAEGEADDGADQLHPRTLQCPVIERVAEDHGVTSLLGDM